MQEKNPIATSNMFALGAKLGFLLLGSVARTDARKPSHWGPALALETLRFVDLDTVDLVSFEG